ncbi:MAG TPA: hydrogenase 3 maturation endopeptidase HyCI [Candidatus Omnitrophota bacterium]|nr:hydrogenase 3 maturation endopeptidase HyCI [Candidatus Omnitrophota bacterium]
MISTIEKNLGEALKGKVIILGIGNPLRKDDGFGSLLAVRLQGKVSALVIDAKSTPENHLNKIIEEAPDTILILDAADFKGNPAEMRVLDPREASNLQYFSTHNLPLNLIVEFLEHNCQANIVFLALQPKSIGFGEDVSPEVIEKIRICEELLKKFLPNN